MPDEPTPTPVAVTPPDAAKPDPLAASVAAAVSKLRRDAGLSERAAAKKLGTSQTQLRRMEDPRYLPSLRSLQRVAQAYGVSLAVTFEPPGAEKERAAKPAAPPARTERARPARASASPSKARRAAPGRARAGARRTARRTARRQRAR